MRNLIPHFIADKYRNNEYQGKFQAVTMFLDISGFTPMTEKLMKHGKEGAEILSGIINNIFEPTIALAYKDGGFISSFAGDAFTVIYANYQNPMQILSCALEINQLFNKIGKQKTKYGEFKLYVKLGLSFGIVEYGIIGNKNNRTYYFRGEAIDGCADSEQNCDKMEIVLDSAILDIIDKSNLGLKIINDKYYKLISLIYDDFDRNGSYIIKDFKVEKKLISEFIPEKVIELKIQGELREIVSVFISLKENDRTNEMIFNIKKEAQIYGGYFNRVSYGDKGCSILIFFGAPISYENNTIRAVNFANRIKIEYSEFLRIGITEGIVFAGFIGSEIIEEYTCFGDVVNLSARFMMKAEFGEIWLSEETSNKLIGKYKVFDLGKIYIKGKSNKIQVFKLKNQIRTMETSFFEGIMVGREAELSQLKFCSKPLQEGKFAGIISIYGEAGMGKSRLIYEFIKDKEDYQILYMQTESILKNSMNPFQNFMNNYFGQIKAETIEEKKEAFEQIFSKLITKLSELEDNRKISIINELEKTKSILSTQIDIFYKNSLYEQLDPKGRYENTISAYKEFFKGLSLIKPIIIQIEDIHWLDVDSHQVFRTLCRNIENYPIMILATSRFNDDRSKPMIKTDKEIKHQEIVLNKLEDSAANSLIELQLKGKAGQNLLDLIKSKTELNPFYIEQLICYLRENELLSLDNNLYKIRSIDIEIPSNINAIIIARIDRLESNIKNIVQIASILGREVELKLLLTLLNMYESSHDTKEIKRFLKAIEDEHLWYNYLEIKYIFEHALLHEAVYEMQLKTRIRELHELAAMSLINIYGYSEDKLYEIANHFDKAENFNQATIYYKKAGKYYQKNYKNLNAIECYDRYLKIAKNIATDKIDISKILSYKGEILRLIGKWDEAEKVYLKSIEILSETNNEILLAKHRCFLGWLLQYKNQYKEAMKLFKSALETAEKNHDKQLLAIALSGMGGVYFEQDDYTRAMHCFEEKKKIYFELEDKLRYSKALGDIGLLHDVQGDYLKAIGCYEERKNMCLEFGDKRGISIALGDMGLAYKGLFDYTKAMQYYEEALKIHSELGDRMNYAKVSANMGNVHFEQGNFFKAIEYYEEAKKICLELGSKSGYLIAIANMGLVYENIGDYIKAMECYEQAIYTSKELNIKSRLCNYFYNKANLLYIQKDYENAKLSNKEANQLAIEMQNQEIIFKSTILTHKLDALEISEQAVENLLQMLQSEKDEKNQAIIHYEIYTINNSDEHRQEALELYQKLYHITHGVSSVVSQLCMWSLKNEHSLQA